MMSQAQISTRQRRDTQAISQDKDYASIQAELEFWFTINSARYSNKNIQLLKVWHIFKIRLKYNGEYLEIANYLYDRNTITPDEREVINTIYLWNRIADTEPYRLEEKLLLLYHILRHNSPDYNIHSDLTSPWADGNFSTAWPKLVHQQHIRSRIFCNT